MMSVVPGFSIKSLSKIELIIISVLLSVSFILRFPQLGYSHFYGDETKAVFYNKSISITDYLLDQRKGPVQFIITWLTENTFNSFNEVYIRLPFALSGFLSVIIFYLIVRNMFGWKEAAFASSLFTLSGFNIAFSRTAQYQSVLIMFCLVSIFLSLLYENNKVMLIFLSSIFLSLGILTHYDSLFFVIPAAMIFFKSSGIKNFTIYFLIPVIIFSTVFYGPYLINGYFSERTQNYVIRRITGQEYRPSSSVYTMKVYNPDVFYLLIMLFSFFYFANESEQNSRRRYFATGINYKKITVFFWFLIPFIVFELIFQNPGTHINNYLIPIYIMSGVGFVNLIEKNSVSFKLKKIMIGTVTATLLVSLLIKASVYIPFLNTGYPWKDQYTLYNLRKANNNYHLYLYGFPYYRGWDVVREYMLTKKGVRGIYTNDNAILAEYYLREFDITPPGSNYLPQYYIDVVDNQEFKLADPDRGIYTNDNAILAEYYLREFDITPPGSNYLPQYYIDVVDNQEFKLADPVLLSSYSIEKEIYVDGILNATIYKKLISVL